MGLSQNQITQTAEGVNFYREDKITIFNNISLLTLYFSM